MTHNQPIAQDKPGYRQYEYHWLKQLPLPLLQAMWRIHKGDGRGRPFRTAANAAWELRQQCPDRIPALYLQACNNEAAFNDVLGGGESKLSEAVSTALETHQEGQEVTNVDLSAYALKTEVNSAIVAVLEDTGGRIKAGLGKAEGVYESALEAIRRDCHSAIAETIKAAHLPHEIVIKRDDGPKVNIGTQHKQFPDLLSILQCRCHAWLAGPAASGKTTAAINAAKALGLPFYFNGCLSDEFKVLGFTDAMGRVIRTPFREAYEHGGIWLNDEADGNAAEASIVLNGALGNGKCAFPDGVIEQHPDFYCIVGANTYGNGATFEYVGRTKQDAAFLDRFCFLFWDYDETIEDTAGNADWVALVRRYRTAAARQGLKVLITPRASFMGAKLLASGMERDTVIALTIKKGMTSEQWSAIQREVA